MSRRVLLLAAVFVCGLGARPAYPVGKGDKPSIDLEIDFGGSAGDDLMFLLGSNIPKSFGGRVTFGFNQILNPELQYGYSDRTSDVSLPTLIFITLAIQSNNWNWFSLSNPIHLYQRGRTVSYVSPGVGFVRSGARQFQEISDSGTATAPLPSDTTTSFDLGTGVKFFPIRRFDIRLAVREILTSASSGNFQPIMLSNGTSIDPNQVFPNGIPGRRHIRITAGLIFRLR